MHGGRTDGFAAILELYLARKKVTTFRKTGMQNRKGNYHEKKTISFIDSSGAGGRYAGRMRFTCFRANRGSAKDRGFR